MIDTKEETSASALVPFLWVLTVGVIAHGLLLLTDYVLWDGTWMLPQLATRLREGSDNLYSPELLRLYEEMGKPLDLVYLTPFVFFAGAIAPKVASFLVWLASPLLALFVMQRLALLPSAQATAVASIMAALPVFDVLGEISLWMNAAAVMFFWLAWVAVAGVGGRRGVVAVVLRLSALVLFFFSFTLNSLLLFFYGCAAFLLLCRWYHGTRRRLIPYAFKSSLKLCDFALLPVVFWVHKSVFTPLAGYAQKIAYNEIKLDPQLVLTGFRSLGAFLAEEASGLVLPLCFVAVLLAVALLLLKSQKSSASRYLSFGERVAVPDGCLFLGGGFTLLLCAALPYILVGQDLASFGWWSRNCVLTPLPLALLVCGAFMLGNSVLAPHRPHLWFWACVCVAFASAVVCNRNYLILQALGAKQESIGIKASEAVAKSNATVVQLRDYFLIPGSIQYYTPNVWTFICSGGQLRPTTFVLDTTQMARHQITTDGQGNQQVVFPALPLSRSAVKEMTYRYGLHYYFGELSPEGRQIMFVVQPGKYGIDGVAIGSRYLWLKWFDRSKLSDFLNQLTETQVLELPPIDPA